MACCRRGTKQNEALLLLEIAPRAQYELSDWQYEQYSGFSLRDIPINLVRDTRNQPAFSLFSWTREAG
jgi:hypothetical protein